MRPDDSLPPDELALVRRHAQRTLEAAGAVGRIPTPVADVMDAAKLIVSPEDVLNDDFLIRLRRKAGDALKRALSKVWGVIDVKARLVYVDRAVLLVKQTFLKLHETAHAILPWQSKMYAVIEDCEKTLAPEVSEQFDRQANAFASEVLFQLQTFTEEAAGHPVGLKTPLKLSRDYGASVYATIRRYVSTHQRVCAVLVLDPPEMRRGDGFVCPLRRFIPSPAFKRLVGKVDWPDYFSPDDEIGAFIPINRRMTGPRALRIVNTDETAHDCIAEAFTQKYHVFILIHSVKAVSPWVSVLSSV